jgi:hydroxymethylbilane synthase
MGLKKERKKQNRIAIGTRSSKLALWQAEWIKSELKRLNPGLDVGLVKIKTTGDKILDVPLAKIGGKGLFVKEIEEALLRHEVDIAVHSMKDVPTEFPAGLHLAVICKREDPRDAFVSRSGDRGFEFASFKSLPGGATVGTSSLRRACQLLHIRPDLSIEQLRGNLDTRLRKLDEGRYNAVILAAAGIKRLGLAHRITELLPLHVSLPAIGQGAIGIECRIDDERVNRLIASLNHTETALCVKAERAFLKKLEGGCQVPVAAHARLQQTDGAMIGRPSPGNTERGDSHSLRGQSLWIDGLVGSLTGDRMISGSVAGNPDMPEQLGIQLADDILARGAKEILDEVYGKIGRS